MKKMNIKVILGLSLALSMSLILVGCGNNSASNIENNTKETLNNAGFSVSNAVDNGKNKIDETVKDTENDLRDMNYSDIKVDAAQAFDKFMELHPEAEISEIDLDKEIMEYQYVIEGFDEKNEYEVKIDPFSGEVLSDDTEAVDMDDREEDMAIKKEYLAKVDKIIDMAQKEDGSESELDEWSISSDDGKIVMDIEIGISEYSYDMESEELLESDK